MSEHLRHDELGASLTAIKFDVTYVGAKLKDTSPALAERLQRALEMLRGPFHLKQRLVQEQTQMEGRVKRKSIMKLMRILLTDQGVRRSS
jgi:hypothetical protein